MASKTHQTQNARYVVHLPAHDTLGNLLADLGPVSHEWLRKSIPNLIHSIHTEGPYAGHSTPTEINRHLHVLAYDTPEVDSHVKQLAAHVGQLTNHPTVFVSKDGQTGMQAWTIPNKAHNGGPAAPEAMAFLSPSNTAE